MLRWIVLLLVTLPLCASPTWSVDDDQVGWQGQDLVNIYHHNSELQRQWACQALALYRFTGEERVLDFGCGDGKISAQISFQSSEVVGADLSSSMIEFATAMFNDRRYDNLTFVQDWSHLGTFDLIVSFSVFHVVPDPLDVLSRLRESLTPGGTLVLAYPARASDAFYRAMREEFAERGREFPAKNPSAWNMRDPRDALQVLEAAGYSVCHLSVQESETVFNSESDLVNWLEGSASGNWSLSLNERHDFVQSLTRRYLDLAPECRKANGTVTFPFQHIQLLATNP